MDAHSDENRLPDVKHLRLFELLYSTRSVSRSAELLGLGAMVARTDLIATLPRHIGETLAQIYSLAIHPCPVPVPGFAVKQHWHARFHTDPGNLWLRGVCAGLFMGREVRGASQK